MLSCVTCCCTTSTGLEDSQTQLATSQLPLDLAAVLTSALMHSTHSHAEAASALLWTLPWVVRCLAFCSWDAHSALSVNHAARLVAAIHASAALKPSHQGFGLGALLLSSLLDDFRERSAVWLASLPEVCAKPFKG